MKADKEYFFNNLKKNSGGEVEFNGMLDGCYVFRLYHKEDLTTRSGPPIYAVCDPNNPRKVKVEQSLDIAAMLYKQQEK